jgi:hypothetical protein
MAFVFFRAFRAFRGQNAVALTQRRLDSFALAGVSLSSIRYGSYQAGSIFGARFCRTLLLTGMIRRQHTFI